MADNVTSSYTKEVSLESKKITAKGAKVSAAKRIFLNSRFVGKIQREWQAAQARINSQRGKRTPRQ